MQKIEVEGIVVFENLLASLVFQKINFYCLQRLRQSLGDIYIYIYILFKRSSDFVIQKLFLRLRTELASRDTTSPHFLHEINSAGTREGGSSAPLEKEGGSLQKI